MVTALIIISEFFFKNDNFLSSIDDSEMGKDQIDGKVLFYRLTTLLSMSQNKHNAY